MALALLGLQQRHWTSPELLLCASMACARAESLAGSKVILMPSSVSYSELATSPDYHCTALALERKPSRVLVAAGPAPPVHTGHSAAPAGPADLGEALPYSPCCCSRVAVVMILAAMQDAAVAVVVAAVVDAVVVAAAVVSSSEEDEVPHRSWDALAEVPPSH